MGPGIDRAGPAFLEASSTVGFRLSPAHGTIVWRSRTDG